MQYDFDKKINRKANGSIKWHESGCEDVIEMGTADMDFETATEIVDALIECAKAADFGYMLKPESYYDAIIEWNRDNYGWELNKENIADCPGMMSGIGMALRALSRPGDVLLVDSPFFGPIPEIARNNGLEVVTVPLIHRGDGWEPDLVRFEMAIMTYNVKFFALVNPQNPTGRVYRRKELEEIASICYKYGVTVISDEVHGTIVYDGELIPFTSVSEEAKKCGIVLTSATKGFNLQGLTYGLFITENPNFMEKYKKELHKLDFDYSSNIFSVAAIEAAYSKGGDWLKQLTEYLRGNRDYAVKYIKERIPKIYVDKPEATYLLFMDCSALQMNEPELKRFFNEQCGVEFNYGSKFGARYCARMNFACRRELLAEALERMEKGINSLTSGGVIHEAT